MHLQEDFSFAVTNFPASHRFGEKAFITGVGYWELEPSYEAFLIKFRVGANQYVFRIVGRRSPFVLASSIYDDDESLKARRVEDNGK